MRNCYTPADVASFRDQVVRDLVPLTVKIKERQAKRLGIAWEDFTFTDNALSYKDGSATPQGTPEEILAAGKKMYEELSPETRDFIHLMFDNELFDVLAKDGKAPGGYCTSLPDYQCPFIFSNFNGTSGDVDVLTHEAGHAFADFIASQTVAVRALSCPTMEGAETHSMSMESSPPLATTCSLGADRQVRALPRRGRFCCHPLRLPGGPLPGGGLPPSGDDPRGAQPEVAGAGGPLPPLYQL